MIVIVMAGEGLEQKVTNRRLVRRRKPLALAHSGPQSTVLFWVLFLVVGFWALVFVVGMFPGVGVCFLMWFLWVLMFVLGTFLSVGVCGGHIWFRVLVLVVGRLILELCRSLSRGKTLTLSSSRAVSLDRYGGCYL